MYAECIKMVNRKMAKEPKMHTFIMNETKLTVKNVFVVVRHSSLVIVDEVLHPYKASLIRPHATDLA